MAKNTVYSLDQLKRAVEIHEQIEKLQTELAKLFGQSAPTQRGRKPGKKAGTSGGNTDEGASEKKKAKRTRSPEAREKMAQAQKKRWAKTKKTTS